MNESSLHPILKTPVLPNPFCFLERHLLQPLQPLMACVNQRPEADDRPEWALDEGGVFDIQRAGLSK